MSERKYIIRNFNKPILAGIILVLALVLCNLTFIASNGWARVGWGVLGYTMLLLAYKMARLTLDDIGLSPKNYKQGLKIGGYTSLIILAGFLMFFIIDKAAFNDQRYHHSLSTALYASVILLPVKTVFFEELAFRGIFPAVLIKLRKSQRFATVVSSLAFGLWHINSASKISAHSVGSVTIPKFLIIMGVVAVTTLAGVIFCELRWRSKSLVAPLVVHWFINGFATILASLSWS